MKKIIPIALLLLLCSCSPRIEYIEVPVPYTVNNTVLEEQIKELEHSLWHYDEQAKCLQTEKERLNQLLIDSGVFVLEHEVIVDDTGNISGVLRSYKYVKPEPEVVTVNQTVEKEVIREIETLVFTDNLSEWILPWESVYELRQWLASDNISEREYKLGVYDCEDFAIDTCLAALLDRKLMIPFAEGAATKHGNVMGLAFVENNVYLINPMWPDGRPEYWGKRD